MVDTAAREQFLSEYLGFPYQSLHSLSSIIQDWYNRPVVAKVIVDSVSHHPKKEKK
jgi:hypothetical protein